METNNECFSCDYCHRVGTGITIINGFKMCTMCLAEYQHKSGENNKLREELEKSFKENSKLKAELKKAYKAIDNLECDLREQYQAVDELDAELEELKKNVIVPKFKVGDECYAFTDHFAYFSNDKVKINDIKLTYICQNDTESITYKEQSLFKTKQEAEEALRKLEEK